MGEFTSPGLFQVKIERVRESLESLADDIEFIATGKADDSQTTMRGNGGQVPASKLSDCEPP